MQAKSSRQFQVWLMVLTVLSAAVLGYLVVWLASGGLAADLPRRRAVLGVSEEDPTATEARIAQSVPRTTGTPLATPTFIPSNAATATAESPLAVVEAPPTESAFAEAPSAAPQPPTDLPALPPAAPTAAPVRQVPVTSSSTRLEDTVWQGGWKQSKPYGGRNATWIYGTGTEYSSMQAVVLVDEPVTGRATLSVEGMDSEDRPKTPIRITINGSEIFSGPNPLPNDDQPLDSGTWAMHNFAFDARVLQSGRNTIRISTAVPGAFRQPPFFMLDYAVLTLPGEPAAPAPPKPTPTDAPPAFAPSAVPTTAPTETPVPTNVPTEVAAPTEAPTEAPTVEPSPEPAPTDVPPTPEARANARYG